MKKLVAFLLTAVMAFSCVAYGGSSEDTLKIGFLHPTSGSLAYDGQLHLQAMQMAVDEINEAGGIQNLGGRKLEIVVYDTEGDAAKAVAGVQKLANDGCVIITGTAQSATAKTASVEAERLHIPFVITSAAMANIIQEGYDYTFRPQPNSEQFARDGLIYMKQILEKYPGELKTIAFIHEQSEYGTGMAKVFAEGCGDLGLEVLGDIGYDVTASTYVPEITKLQQWNPDIIMTTGYYSDQSLLRKEALERGWEPKLYFGIGSAAIADPKFIAEFGEDANGLCDVNIGYNVGNPMYKEITEKFRSITNDDLSMTSGMCYVAALVAADALERAASDSWEDVAQALRETDMDGLDFLADPRIKFDENGENVYATAIFGQIQNGEELLIGPESCAQVEFEKTW